MYRMYPVWLRENMSDVMNRFSLAYARHAVNVNNLHALPGFATPSFEADGVHLTAYSGLEFVLHLFDASKVTLDALISDPESRQTATCEVTRSLGDRMIALEQDHRRLSSAYDLKYAIDAELACLRSNERSEDSLIISGLRRTREGLSGREWQEEAKKEVKRVLRLVVDKDIEVIVVHNVTGRSTSGPVSYSVKLSSVDDSRLIRSKFSSYFSGKKDARPPALKEISIRNVLTKETRIRISIMKIIGKRYEDSNPGASFQVIGFEPRPLLKITPPKDASDKRIKTFSYIEAVQKLRVVFSDDDLESLSKQLGSRYNGRVKSTFVILDEDMLREARSKSKTQTRPKRGLESGSGDEAPPRQRSKD
jgi:hypothetical protein